MTVLLDTSAVIGWFERRNPKTVELVAEDGAAPAIHAVSLGELADGWQRAVAERRSKRDVQIRRRTFEVARDEFTVVNDLDPLGFAAVAALARRSLSHNEIWIAAAAAARHLQLLTEDRDLGALHGATLSGRSLRVVVV